MFTVKVVCETKTILFGIEIRGEWTDQAKAFILPMRQQKLPVLFRTSYQTCRYEILSQDSSYYPFLSDTEKLTS